MSGLLETIMESREEFMVSPVGDRKPTLRTAHFLKPSVTFNDGPISKIPSSSMSLPPTFEPKKWPFTVKFSGWPSPPKKWIQWVDSLHSTYESVWRKVGIYEAIMGTKCHLLKNEDLVFGIAERWCSKTNTFVFPWAEATITLEDMMFLGGYPVLGDSVFRPLETQELKEIEEKLILARRETSRSKSNNASIHMWMSIFMNSGREIEHEAFLTAWLSMFVFPEKYFLVRKLVFPIAIRLARGSAIALAAAVLASIYKDLSLLKQTIVDLTKILADSNKKRIQLVLQSPLYLVQIWVWERIDVLQPKPGLINYGDTVLGKWHKVKALEIDNVRSVLDSAMEEFIWRPYARFGGKSKRFYAEKSMCVPLDHTLDKEIESFIICLRVSELVGLDCIKQYLPHRVAMQFGMDQDIPVCVTRINETPEIAWANYNRPIMDSNVYIPSRFFEADVTTRYAQWWKKSVLGHQDPNKNIVQGKRSPRSSKKRGNDADVPPGFSPKCSKGPLRNNGHRSFGNDETDQNGVLLSPVAAHKTGVSMTNRVEKLPKSENVKVVRGTKRATEDAKGDDVNSFASTVDSGTMRKMNLWMKSLPKVKSETSMGGLKEATEYAYRIQESTLAHNRVNLSWTEGEGTSNTIEIKIMDLENRISRLERVLDELKVLRLSHIS